MSQSLSDCKGQLDISAAYYTMDRETLGDSIPVFNDNFPSEMSSDGSKPEKDPKTRVLSDGQSGQASDHEGQSSEDEGNIEAEQAKMAEI